QGGKIINQLQTSTATRVKLSQKNEFFPGTQDRVALVQGEDPKMVAEAVGDMLRRLGEAARPNPQAPQGGGSMVVGMGHHLHHHHHPYPSGHEGYGFGGGGGGGADGLNAQVLVRLLVPLAAGGLIIGRGGETIKDIGSRTGKLRE
ncbi:unnamed protein product, partial [Hapterophycus canaliculatus]